LGRRTHTECQSDAIVRFIGNQSVRSVPLRHFGAFVSSESVFLTIFVLISQNRMSRQAERPAHLDLQVGMLAEQELTMMLQMLQKLCHHAGVDVKSAN
jgi:uncharacterized membrane protein